MLLYRQNNVSKRSVHYVKISSIYARDRCKRRPDNYSDTAGQWQTEFFQLVDMMNKKLDSHSALNLFGMFPTGIGPRLLNS